MKSTLQNTKAPVMTKAVFEAGIKLASKPTKVSDNIKPKSIRFVAKHVIKALGLVTVEDVVEVVAFIRRNREESTTIDDQVMMDFFGGDYKLTVGVIDRKCAIAFPLFKSGLKWSDRSEADKDVA
jgi:hypothetical protein